MYVLAVLQIGYGVAEVLDLVEREERSAGSPPLSPKVR